MPAALTTDIPTTLYAAGVGIVFLVVSCSLGPTDSAHRSGGLGALLRGTAPETAASKPPFSADDEGFLGLEVCQGCHRIETEHWSDTLHAAAFRDNPRSRLERRTCEACHGPGARHLADPSDRSAIVAFTRDGERAPEELNAVCLQCHADGPRLHWSGSVHDGEGLACSDCHNPMSRISSTGLLREKDANTTCFSCHPAQRTEFRKRSHMPLFEGKLSCVDCHQPHGSQTDPLLRAGSTFELCTNCHADKRGPFLWEHAPVTEGCTSCHLPHGSNRDSLLVTSPPFLCQQCHAQIGVANHPIELQTPGNLAGGAGATRDPRFLARGCVTCHSQIHGSNHPSGARFHR